MKALRILSLPVDRGGCGWYRVRQPFQQMKLHTKHDAEVLEKDEDGVIVAEAMKKANVVVIRQGGELGIDAIKRIPEFKHLKYVLDIDDNIEMISPYSEHYSEYGVKEFKDIWVDGQTFNLSKNRSRVISLMAGLTKADMVTVTTERLASYARQFNGNVKVLPNSIDVTKWWKLPTKPNKPLRIGWSGGVSHYEDWYSIKEPLNRLMKKYQFKLVSIGAHFEGVIDPQNRHLVEVRPWVPFEAHSYRMMCMALDIAIIPLADLPFNHYKSAIKFYEFSAMEVPSVISNVPPYAEVVKHRENALVYNSSSEFETQMSEIIEDETLREKIGKGALNEVTKNRNAALDAHIWAKAYQSLFEV